MSVYERGFVSVCVTGSCALRGVRGEGQGRALVEHLQVCSPPLARPWRLGPCAPSCPRLGSQGRSTGGSDLPPPAGGAAVRTLSPLKVRPGSSHTWPVLRLTPHSPGPSGLDFPEGLEPAWGGGGCLQGSLAWLGGEGGRAHLLGPQRQAASARGAVTVPFQRATDAPASALWPRSPAVSVPRLVPQVRPSAPQPLRQAGQPHALVPPPSL